MILFDFGYCEQVITTSVKLVTVFKVSKCCQLTDI